MLMFSRYSCHFSRQTYLTHQYLRLPFLLTLKVLLLEGKLNTNYVPTTVEIDLIEHELAKSEAQLSSLAAAIGRLQDRCKQLTVDKERLSIGIAKGRGMLAPARRLIPEILQEIFYHCLPTTHNAVMSALDAPLLLGRVCSHWRQIAYSTPQLWTSIHIVIPFTRPYEPAFPTDNTLILAAVSQWLARSGVLPLSISMISSVYSLQPFIPTNGHIRPFLDLLNSLASRWRSVSFDLENYAWAEFFDLYGAEDVPLLEKVHFDGTQTAANAVQGDFGAAIRENGILYAPRLRSVSIPRFAPEILQLPVRWSELLELNLSDGSFLLRDILMALGQCPELRNCSISVSNASTTAYAEEGLPPPKITVPMLEVLTLRNCSSQEGMRILLESLITPQLCHLSYHQPFAILGVEADAQPSHERRLMEAFDTFLRNLIVPLQELELEANGLLFATAMGLLEMVPDLKRLSIVSYGVTENLAPRSFLRMLARHSSLADQALRRFIPSVLTIQHQSASPVSQMSQGDDYFDIDLNPFPLDKPVERVLSGPLMSSHPESKMVVGRLCPKLKVFDCSGAVFSESTFLEFLRARSLRHQELDVAHLKSVNVVYVPGRKQNEDFTNQVLELGKLTGINVYLTYTDVPHLPASRDTVQHSENTINPPTHFGFW